jgi:hypothetical protein
VDFRILEFIPRLFSSIFHDFSRHLNLAAQPWQLFRRSSTRGASC